MDHITHFHIDKFKSLHNFTIPFPPSPNNTFLCLIGKNGSGKSTVLQAIDFAGEIFRGKISPWLKSRNWEKRDISSFQRLQNINLDIEGRFNGHTVNWSSSFNIQQLRCTQEKIRIDGNTVFSVADGKYRFFGENEVKNIFTYEGSILSILDKEILEDKGLAAFCAFMKKMYSFDTLNSKQLRMRTRPVDADTNIGRGGEFLSGKIATFSAGQIKELLAKVCEFYPWIINIYTSSLRGGWKELFFVEKSADGGTHRFSSQNSCDGLLRLVGFLTEFMTSDTFIIFDEIENGFNPEIMEKLVRMITDFPTQIIITTHNPVIINYMQEDIAIESTLLVYRKQDGTTGIRRFFEIPEVSERLSYLSPGEVFLDVDIDDVLIDTELV